MNKISQFFSFTFVDFSIIVSDAVNRVHFGDSSGISITSIADKRFPILPASSFKYQEKIKHKQNENKIYNYFIFVLLNI